MFALAKTAIPKCLAGTRGYTARAVYVGNLGQATTVEKLHEAFGHCGNIVGIRLGSAPNGYRYGHIYFGVGEVPMENGVAKYDVNKDSTPEEIDEVESATNKALQVGAVELDGNTIFVRNSVNRRAGSSNPPGNDSQGPQRRNANNRSGLDREAEGYKRGFADGYRQGVKDAKNSEGI
ncbi:hypothetical protein GGI25_002402 [Coemansia spiralis]|uniref:RRM domain-containing protein n=2 Tax=Coemansia TaxID=4863 RepID=A0A9W8KZ47_9FUNG|nr:hypothetical protein BX070DRAFT_232841 [Coemansia spiralis]KAJ1991294.1 hypothetical protein EDC05_003513 [Coemansia umbellata]KAJ2622208.1 hypothetical protein GGI26_003503 [Coemansia sp. RSA 1358]KAJ2678417.1 hypothetical protein GGI25_002402 [Coemansia spiralis]